MDKSDGIILKKFYASIITAFYILFGGFLIISLFLGIINKSNLQGLDPFKPVMGLTLLFGHSLFYLEIERRITSRKIFTSFRFVSITALSSFLFSLFFFIIFLAFSQKGCYVGWEAFSYLVMTALLSGATGFLLIFRIIYWFFNNKIKLDSSK